MTRKLPADIPSPELRGGIRPDRKTNVERQRDHRVRLAERLTNIEQDIAAIKTFLVID